MASYLIQESTLKSMANSIRAMSGTSQTMTANEMVTNLRTLNNGVGEEIDAQTDLISQIKTALESKGYTVGGTT